jgi:phospholipase C
MSLNHVPPAKWRATALASALALLTSTMPMSAQTAPAAVVRSSTKTPIQHVIVIIGENRTFDHIFATYKPTIQGETIDNLLSKPIISEDGSPGPNYGLSLQFSAVDNAADKYQISPGGESLYSQLPPPRGGRLLQSALQ